ncbi:MAG TPA: aminoacyl-tRNA hydrolase [Bacteroidales bacterium]|nr:aminoacyl-tRNA hydrolase [Bacteroidales bacterium]HPT10278.1 aminoacyl-tRNA hydrolase [Bacteroidales bacterium]
MKYLIVGLGNIGDDYADTRHNIGFLVADALAATGDASFKSDRHAAVTKITLKGRTLVVIKPSTFMNLSGKAVRYWMQKEEIPLENILIIVDDLALPLGALRLRTKGSDGGHNGLISIIEYLESSDFSRIRFGIGNDFAKGYQIDYVLGRWSDEETKILMPKVKEAVEMIKSFVLIGPERTMNFFNKRGVGDKPSKTSEE